MPKVTLDRFEEGVAVLVLGEQEVKRPREALPHDAREGDVLDLETLRVDRAATQRLRAEVKRAREAALKKKPAPPGDFNL